MFFKTSNLAALVEWDRYLLDNQTLSEEARKLEVALGFGCRSVFNVSIGGRRFHGVQFPNDERPFARELWTVQRKASGWSCVPRLRVPARLRAQATALMDVWRDYRPVTHARTDDLLSVLGLDFSVTLFGPFEWFRVGDVIYLGVSIKPSCNHMVEILSDEFYAARKQADALYSRN